MRPLLFVLILSCSAVLRADPIVSASAVNPAVTFHLHLVGDSTMADKPTWPPQPERGWGQLLPQYFRDPTVVINYAVNGRSTKSFIDEGRWEHVRAALRPGDWVIIQFGHNDEKKENPAVYADAATSYRENLRRFVNETRAAQAHPVLATPIARRRFEDTGKLVDTHGAYPDAMRAVAKELDVPLLDLTPATSELLRAYGPERSKQLFLWIAPGEYEELPKGRQDDTHLSAVGADRVAELAIAEMKRLNLDLVAALKPSNPLTHQAHEKAK